MLSISHSLTGAYIATLLPNPLISTPLILASHYLEDYIPHWDVGTGLSTGKRKRSHAVILELIELAIMAALVFLLWQLPRGWEIWNPQVFAFNAWYGASVALIPDFLEAPRNFFNWEPKWLKPFNDFHGKFHCSTPSMVVGLAPQVLLWIVIATLTITGK